MSSIAADAVAFEAAVESGSSYPQQSRGLGPIAMRLLQSVCDRSSENLFLHLLEGAGPGGAKGTSPRCDFSGKMPGFNRSLDGSYQLPDLVSQLTNISGPIVGAEDFEYFRTEARPLLPVLSTVDPDEVVHQQWDVLSPVPKRREADRCDVEAVIEVLAKTLPGYHLLEVPGWPPPHQPPRRSRYRSAGSAIPP